MHEITEFMAQICDKKSASTTRINKLWQPVSLVTVRSIKKF